MSLENDTAQPVETVTPTEPTGAPVENTEATATSPDDPSAKPKRQHWASTRINELVRDREETRRERDHWRELALQKQGITKEQDRKEVAQGKPESSNFDTYEAYIDALTDWKVEHRIKTEREKAESSYSENQKIAQQQQAFSGFEARAEKVREKYEDFDDVAFSNFKVTEAMTAALLESELGPDILYYLGNNPKEAARIARLSPYAQAREIGKLEAKYPELSKTTSTAPAPISPVKPKSQASDEISDSDDMKTFIAKRNKQLGRK